jgi:hypothetical protein
LPRDESSTQAGPAARAANAGRGPSIQARSAAIARRPSGTTRSLSPLPRQVQKLSARCTSVSRIADTSDARQPVA